MNLVSFGFCNADYAITQISRISSRNRKIGTKKRDDFEKKAQYFVISETLKEARHEANMTQEQLANKVGTKKSYISRLENGKCDIQLSTLYRIFEDGLGRRVSLLIG